MIYVDISWYMKRYIYIYVYIYILVHDDFSCSLQLLKVRWPKLFFQLMVPCGSQILQLWASPPSSRKPPCSEPVKWWANGWLGRYHQCGYQTTFCQKWMKMVSLGWKLKEKIQWISMDLTSVHAHVFFEWSSLLGWIMRGNPSWSSVVGIWKKKRWFSAPHSGRWLISHHVSRVWLNHQVTVGTTHHSTSKAEKLCEGEHPRFVDQQNVTMIKGPLWKTPPLITPWSCYSSAIDICCSHGVDTGVIETRIQNLLYIYWWLMNHGPSKWVDWDMMTWGHSFGSLTIQFPQESMKVASRMASRMALRYKASSKHKQLNNVGILESPKRMGNPQLSFWLPWISALPRDAVPPFVLPNSTADAKGQCLGGLCANLRLSNVQP